MEKKLLFLSELPLQMAIYEQESEEPKPPALGNDLLKMLDELLFTDFELKCSDAVTLKCHKNILAARSPIFYAMISADLREAQQGFVNIREFNSTIMRQVLRFIYSENVEDLDKIACDLIGAAQKYQLEDLKKKCIGSIYKNLTKDNAVEVLQIVRKINGCEKLLDKVVRVVAG